MLLEGKRAALMYRCRPGRGEVKKRSPAFGCGFEEAGDRSGTRLPEGNARKIRSPGFRPITKAQRALCVAFPVCDWEDERKITRVASSARKSSLPSIGQTGSRC